MILDTNAISALADGDPSIATVLASSSQLAVPVIALGEYRHGIAASRFRKQYEEWLNELLPRVSVLPVDEDTAGAYASVIAELKRKGKPIPTNDAWIAAIGLQHRMPIVSRDSHFDHVDRLHRLSW